MPGRLPTLTVEYPWISHARDIPLLLKILYLKNFLNEFQRIDTTLYGTCYLFSVCVCWWGTSGLVYLFISFVSA